MKATPATRQETRALPPQELHEQVLRRLQRNPVRNLHRKFFSKTKPTDPVLARKAKAHGYCCIQNKLYDLYSVKKCYLINYTNRGTACTCMSFTGEAHPSSLFRLSSTFLVDFALLSKKEQQKLVTDWIVNAILLKRSLLGHRQEHQTRVYLLPGTPHKICCNTLKRVIGYGSRAWHTCQVMAKEKMEESE